MTPTNEEVRRQFEAELAKLPKGAQQNIRESMARGESLSFAMFEAGYQAALSSPAVVALVEAAKKLRGVSLVLGQSSPTKIVEANNRMEAALAPFTTGAGHVE